MDVTTKSEIREWLKISQEAGATHMIVVCDTYDHSDYPVSVIPPVKVTDKFKECASGSMTRVMEVYALHLDWEKQLSEHRSMHLEEKE